MTFLHSKAFAPVCYPRLTAVIFSLQTHELWEHAGDDSFARRILGLALTAFALSSAVPQQTFLRSRSGLIARSCFAPFWEGDVTEGESVLFIQDEQSGEARAAVLFPDPGSAGCPQLSRRCDVRERQGLRLETRLAARSCCPPDRGSRRTHRRSCVDRPSRSSTQLTHRDGNGEIMFGGRLEYAEMQTCITYRHAPGLWKAACRSSMRSRCRDRFAS